MTLDNRVSFIAGKILVIFHEAHVEKMTDWIGAIKMMVLLTHSVSDAINCMVQGATAW
jgi:hypothetical protein